MKKLLLIAGLLFALHVSAQNCISVRYFGMTIHPFGDEQAKLQPHRLDEHAYVVANFGGFISADHYIWHDLIAVTLMQGMFTDCSGGWAGFSHLGVRALFLERGKHRFLFGIGPMLYYRQSWHRFPEYIDSGFFNRYHSRHIGDVQYKIFWYGAEFACHYRVTEHFDLNAGFTPGVPLALSFSAGVTWWPVRPTEKVSPVKLLHPKK